MKRLAVYAFIAILSVSIFGGFSSVYAQGIDAQQATGQILNTQNTYEYFSSQVNDSFVAGLASLRQVRTAQTATTNNQNQAATLANIDIYINMVTEMQSTYTSTFSQNRSSGLTPPKTQVAALAAAEQRRLQIWNPLSNATKQEPTAQAVIQVFLRNLSNLGLQAQQIDRGIITAGGAQAQVLNNAQAVGQAGASVSGVVTANDNKKCTSITNASIVDCIDAGVSWFIKNTILQIAGWLLWLVANMFNYAVQIGILNFSQWAPDTLYPIWVIVRQILSLAIVFIGLYLGFMYILGKEDKFEKYIPWVVVFALFVNFSYPLARTAIDVSNVISLNIYASAVGSNALSATITSQDTAGALIMNRLGLSGLVRGVVATSGAGVGTVNSINSLGDLSGTPAALLAVVFVLYAAYIFFMATALIVMRTASLVFLTIASPLLLVDSVLPFLGDKAKQLRKIFFEQLAVGPIFMIMLALTLKFLEVFSIAAKSGTNVGAGGGATIVTFFNILMMLIMLHIMIKVTKSTAGSVGEFGTNFMGKVGGFGLGVATGGAGLLARGTLGRAASAARDSKWVSTNQNSFLGRRAYDMSNSLAKSSFDIRNSKTIAGKMDKIGLGMGMGRKVGYDQAFDARQKDILDRGSRIKTRYEKDVIDTDGTILNRKGDIDEAGEKANDTYVATAGGAMFMSKNQKQKVKDALAEKVNADNDKRIAENKGKGAKEVELYNSIKADPLGENKDGLGMAQKERRANFVANLEKDLKTLEKTDPQLQGDQAQSLRGAINTIKKKERDEKDAFDKQVQDVLYSYNKKTGEDKEKYLTKQSKEIQETVTQLSALNSASVVGEQAKGLTLQNGGESSSLSDKPLTTTPVDFDITEPLKVENVHTESFAEKIAAKRKASLSTATSVAQQEMKRNDPNSPDPQTITPVPGRPLPPRPTGSPIPTAANESPHNDGGQSISLPA